MKHTQVCIIGGGCIGLAAALGLSQRGISVILIDAGVGQRSLTTPYENRVSALNKSSETLLQELGVWSALQTERIQPYTEMDVRDKDSFGQICFDASMTDYAELGYIVENQVIRNCLINALENQDRVELLFETRYQAIHTSGKEALITLESGTPIMAELVVAADGALSPIRQQFKMPLTFWDYDHHALVTTVKTELPHRNSARQVFLPDGPLAFLPLSDPHMCSIVWSTSPIRAAFLSDCDADDFNKQLAAAFDMQAGLCEVVTERASFPLTMRYARQWTADKLVLVGDAAHTIHPLAGLGMNLGLKDVACLVDKIGQQFELGESLAAAKALKAYERERKADAQKHIATMQGLKELFEGAHPIKKLLRGIGLTAVEKCLPLKLFFCSQALK